MKVLSREGLHLGAMERDTRLSLLGLVAVTAIVGGWLYMGFPLLAIPGVVAGVLFVVVTLHSPSLGVLFVVAALYMPIEVSSISAFQSLTAFNILGGGVSVLALVSYGLSRRGVVFPNVMLPLLVFILLTLVSLTFTKDTEITQVMIRKLILNAAFVMLLGNVIDDRKKLWRLLWVIVGMGFLNSVASGVQFALGETVESRAKGLQENENQLGELAAYSLIIAMYYFFEADRAWKRILGLALCAILAVGVVTSISRGAVLSLLVGMGLTLMREGSRRLRLAALFLAFALILLPWLPESFMFRFRNLSSEMHRTLVLNQRGGLSVRGYYAKAGMKIWRAHPVIGVGLGNFGYYFILPDYNPGIHGSKKLPPHNLYVQALSETGTVGFVALCWWILLAGVNFYKTERLARDDPSTRAALRACETVTLVAMIFYFTSGSLVYTNMSMVLTLGYLCRRSLVSEIPEKGQLQPSLAAALPGSRQG